MSLKEYKIYFLNTFIESIQHLKYLNSEGKIVIDFNDLEYIRDVLTNMELEED